MTRITGGAAATPRPERPIALVVADIVAGVILIILGLAFALSVVVSAFSYGTLHSNCGAGPYPGIICNGGVLTAVVWGLLAVAVLGFLLPVGYFLINMVRKRYGFYWPLIGIVATVAFFYLGTWIAGLTLP